MYGRASKESICKVNKNRARSLCIVIFLAFGLYIKQVNKDVISSEGAAEVEKSLTTFEERIHRFKGWRSHPSAILDF